MSNPYRKHLQAAHRTRVRLHETDLFASFGVALAGAALAGAALACAVGCGASMAAQDKKALVTSTQLAAKAYCSFDVDAGVAARGLINVVHKEDIGILRRNGIDAGPDNIVCP